MKKKRPARSLGAKALRNILISALLALYLWRAFDAPAFTQEMALHRNERRSLIDRSRVVFTIESQGEALLGEPLMLLGVSSQTVQTSSRTHSFNVWPRNPNGPTLTVLPSELEYDPALIAGLAAIGFPPQAARAELILDMTAYIGGEVYITEGERIGEIFLFRLKAPPGAESVLDNLFHTTSLPPYTLRFFGTDGTQLAEAANIEK